MLLTAIASDQVTTPDTLKALAECATGDSALTLALLARPNLPTDVLGALDPDTLLHPGDVHRLLEHASAGVRAQVLTNWSATIDSMNRYADLTESEVLAAVSDPAVCPLQHVALALARNPQTPRALAEQALLDHDQAAGDGERLAPIAAATLAFERGASSEFFAALDRRDGALTAQRDAYLEHRAHRTAPDLDMLGRDQRRKVLDATTDSTYARQVLDAARDAPYMLEDVCAAIAHNARLPQQLRADALLAELGAAVNLSRDVPLDDDLSLLVIEGTYARARNGHQRAARVASTVISDPGRTPDTLQRIGALAPLGEGPLLPYQTLLAAHPNTPAALRTALCEHHRTHPTTRALAPLAMPIAEALLLGPDALLDVSVETLRAASRGKTMGDLVASSLRTALQHTGWAPGPADVATLHALRDTRTGTLRDLITAARGVTA